MDRRSRTVNTTHGDLVLSGVSICASPNLNIFVMKFDSGLTFKDHLHGIVSRVSKSWYFEVGETCLCGHLCVASLLLCICPANPFVLFCLWVPAEESHLQHLECQLFLVARLCPGQTSLSLCH